MAKQANEARSIDEMLERDEFYSPYALAKLESELRGKFVPPQKLYGYVRQGYVKVSHNSTGKMQVSREEARKHLSKYAQ